MTEEAAAAEARIFALLDAGDEAQAATVALRTYGPEIFGYMAAVLRNEGAADDAFSELSVDLWKGLARFRRESSLRTWVYKLARHAALRVAQDPYRKRRRELGSGEASRLAQEVRTATAAYLRTDARDALGAIRQELSADDQTLLILRLDRRLGWREIAGVMGADEAVLRKRLERLKKKLCDMARERGLLGS